MGWELLEFIAEWYKAEEPWEIVDFLEDLTFEMFFERVKQCPLTRDNVLEILERYIELPILFEDRVGSGYLTFPKKKVFQLKLVLSEDKEVEKSEMGTALIHEIIHVLYRYDGLAQHEQQDKKEEFLFDKRRGDRFIEQLAREFYNKNKNFVDRLMEDILIYNGEALQTQLRFGDDPSKYCKLPLQTQLRFG